MSELNQNPDENPQSKAVNDSSSNAVNSDAERNARLAEQHKLAAQHHELAAKHHIEAARHHEAGNPEKANESALAAKEHGDAAHQCLKNGDC